MGMMVNRQLHVGRCSTRKTLRRLHQGNAKLSAMSTIAEIEAAIVHLSALQVEELAIWLESHCARWRHCWLPMPG